MKITNLYGSGRRKVVKAWTIWLLLGVPMAILIVVLKLAGVDDPGGKTMRVFCKVGEHRYEDKIHPDSKLPVCVECGHERDPVPDNQNRYRD